LTSQYSASRRERTNLLWALPLTAAVLMAHHIGGKAARDGFFLSNFGASVLPAMVAGGAGFSLVAAWLSGKLMLRFTPRGVVPVALVASGAAQIAEWYLLPVRPGPASVLIYLHMAGLGAVLLSSFWSILNEEFDPREAKRRFGQISAGGTAGGVIGGLAAERVVALFGPAALLLVLALLHFCSAGLLYAFLAPGRAKGTAAYRDGGGAGTVRLLFRSPYLLKLSLLVLVAATGTALLDFVFKVQAAETWGKGPALLRFLALFHAGVALLSMLTQFCVTKRSLGIFGLGRTVSSLPAVLSGGSILAFAVPGFPAAVVARTIEAIVRSSLFRTGYEICFTPVRLTEKRRLKATIDVGAERAGDAIGGGIALLCIWLASSRFRDAVLLLAAGIGLLAFLLTRFLDRAYVKALAQNLMNRAVEVEPEDLVDFTTRSVLVNSGLYGGPGPLGAGSRLDSHLAGADRTAPESGSLRVLQNLRSGDPARVLPALAAADLGDPLLASQAVLLLGRTEFAREVVGRLQGAAGKIVGVLTDYLANPDTELPVRRRIPRVLSALPTGRSVDGLVVGLEDSRFEVRMQCARGLAKLARLTPIGSAGGEKILSAVDRELSLGKVIWESHRLQESEPAALGPEWFDEFLRDRAHASLEYVFALLAVLYDREPLTVAFRSLHVDDRHLRGTALEYLESILPAATRRMLWDIIGEHPCETAPRQAGVVMQDLLRASPSVLLRLQDLKHGAGAEPPSVGGGDPGASHRLD
jgi:AAA family ATP:ADP antiporter